MSRWFTLHGEKPQHIAQSRATALLLKTLIVHQDEQDIGLPERHSVGRGLRQSAPGREKREGEKNGAHPKAADPPPELSASEALAWFCEPLDPRPMVEIK